MAALILAIDFEGSHKNPRVGCPIQLGIALMSGCDVLEQWETLIQPPKHYKSGRPMREVDAYALQVSGITLEDLESAPTPSQVCYSLSALVRAWAHGHRFNVEDVPNVAFNIGYDFEAYCDVLYNGGAYNYRTREYEGFSPILGHRWECASQLARRRLSLCKYGLDDVLSHFELRRSTSAHGALEDAILAGKAYHRLMYPDSMAQLAFVDLGGETNGQ